VISFNEVLEVSTSLAATSAVEFAPAIEPQSALMAPNPHRSVLRPGRAWVAFRRFRDIPQISKMAPMIQVAIGRAPQFQLFARYRRSDALGMHIFSFLLTRAAMSWPRA
jgi:hypothetical protein